MEKKKNFVCVCVCVKRLQSEHSPFLLDLDVCLQPLCGVYLVFYKLFMNFPPARSLEGKLSFEETKAGITNVCFAVHGRG